MAIARSREAEQSLQRHLDHRRRRQIPPPNDPPHLEVRIVDDRNEMIGVGTVAAAKQRVAKNLFRIARKIETALVAQPDGRRLESEPQWLLELAPGVRGDDAGTAMTGIAMASVGGERARGPNPGSTAAAGVNPTFADQLLDHRRVALARAGLQPSLVPVETEPGEIPLHRRHQLRPRSFAVEILEAQRHGRTARTRIQPT